MPIAAAVTLAWSAVYAYLGAFYALLYLRRRAEPEHRSFALLATSMVVLTWGAAEHLSARTMADAARGQSLEYAAQLAGLAFSLELTAQLLAEKTWWTLWLARGAAVVGGLLAMLGLAFDAETNVGLGRALDANYTVLGLAWLGTAWIPTVEIVFRLVRAVRKGHGDAPTLLSAYAIGTVAGVHDALRHSLRLLDIDLLPLVGLGTHITASYVLLRRFVATMDALRARTQELRKSHDDLAEAQRELVRREQLAKLGELSAIIAHEVRNPLAIIKNSVSGLRRATIPESDRDMLLSILGEESERLDRLVSNLLVFARPIEPRSERVVLGDLVRRALAVARADGDPSERIEVSIYPGGEEPVRCDPDLVEQALVNVIDNALQAMPEGGKLEVGWSLGGDGSARIEVRDCGKGMPPEVLQRSREPFYTTRPAGTGLGLAIVERVMRAHGGEVEIESAPGDGTTVRLLLPRVREAEVPSQDPRLSIP